METRTSSPFPTHQCADTDCSNTVPESTRTDLCSSCDNFAQIYGKRPSDVSDATVRLRRTWLFGEVVNWKVIKDVDGDETVLTFRSEELAKQRKREYQAALHALE